MLNNLSSILVPPSGREVSRGIRQHLDAEEEKKSRETLEGKLETPANIRIAAVYEGKAKRQPVSDRNAQIVCNEDISEESSSVSSGRCFRNHDRGNAGEGTSADASDDTRDDHKVAG